MSEPTHDDVREPAYGEQPYRQEGYPPVPAQQVQPYGQPQGYQHPNPTAQQYYAAPTGVAAKNPGLALLASFFFPGLGSLMNGEAAKGIGIFVGYMIAIAFSFVLIGIPFLFGFWIWGMVDGYVGAQRWNLRHGIVS